MTHWARGGENRRGMPPTFTTMDPRFAGVSRRLGKDVLPLPDGEAHVWLALTDANHSPQLLATWEQLLCSEERSHRDRLRFDRDRHRYLLAHALVRKALSSYVDVDPSAWRFVANEHGRPEPMWNGKLPLRCNLSKSTGLVACVVTREADAGVDVEDIRRIDDPMSLARHAFAAEEATDLESLDREEQRVRFFEYWTLKEAYLKGRGVGLSEPLDRVAFTLEGRMVQMWLTGESRPAMDWQFQVSRPLADHVMAIAVRRPPRKDFRIVERWGIPAME